MTPVVCFVGPSGSGKTTLLEQVVALLTERGIRVATLKQTHHAVEWDTPGKDTFRMRGAGAVATMLSTPLATFVARPVDEPPSLEALLSQLPPADLILAEGFKSSPQSKLAVWRRDHPWDPTVVPNVVALAGDPAAPTGPWQQLDLNDPAAVAAWLTAQIGS